MKVISLSVLFTVALISVASCQWRRRSWRNHHDYVYNSTAKADSIARGQRDGSAET
jgi:hypothetical protein